MKKVLSTQISCKSNILSFVNLASYLKAKAIDSKKFLKILKPVDLFKMLFSVRFFGSLYVGNISCVLKTQLS